MENASKALIMAASILIGIMLLSFMVFTFKRFSNTARQTDQKFSEREKTEFNSKFETYETGGSHLPTDEITVTYKRSNTRDNVESTSIKVSDLFAEGSLNTVKDKEYYNKALIAASTTFNTVSDVVTAVNDAINTNYTNNNGYRYSGIDTQISIEVIIDLGEYRNEFNFARINGSSAYYQYLAIEANSSVTPRYVYGVRAPHSIALTGINSEKKEKNINNLVFENDSTKPEFNAVKVYDMLTELRETKVVKEGLKTYTVYKYYFMGEVIKNEDTRLVETVKFTLLKDKNF